jgi:hypothetical protein
VPTRDITLTVGPPTARALTGVLTVHAGLYPSDTLYPSATLYPSNPSIVLSGRLVAQ